MAIPQLQVQTQPAKLNLKTNSAVHEYKQMKAEQSIQQPESDLSIRQRPGNLTIDQSNAWRNLHLKTVFERAEEFADYSNQKWLEGVGQTAREGDELMRIENKGNPIAEQAKRNAVMDFTYQPGDTPGYDLVKVSYDATPADIQVKPNAPIIEHTPRYPQFSYQRGNVDVTLAQHSEVRIDWKI
ncbi:DUF6470 family protein [Halobacillus sp. BBL2006]|uniref:DUF6470 family protein n=1 Tax=Halobacillus sp. BBL2006 TaxID=1543706 RepID=UPI000543C216|nr:DUF6470 family protein [Halobacillus sp. BBL2006]KHE69121.1 hypothetical protein LD39_13395 [Halobacillus sp. BBL2006]